MVLLTAYNDIFNNLLNLDIIKKRAILNRIFETVNIT
jgi:hypothetical protein